MIPAQDPKQRFSSQPSQPREPSQPAKPTKPANAAETPCCFCFSFVFLHLQQIVNMHFNLTLVS